MKVSLTAELEQFVQQKIDSGNYKSANDVVCDALRLLQERETKLEKLRQDLAIGLEQADRGEAAPLDVEEIKTKGRRILEERRERA